MSFFSSSGTSGSPSIGYGDYEPPETWLIPIGFADFKIRLNCDYTETGMFSMFSKSQLQTGNIDLNFSYSNNGSEYVLERALKDGLEKGEFGFKLNVDKNFRNVFPNKNIWLSYYIKKNIISLQEILRDNFKGFQVADQNNKSSGGGNSNVFFTFYLPVQFFDVKITDENYIDDMFKSIDGKEYKILGAFLAPENKKIININKVDVILCRGKKNLKELHTFNVYNSPVSNGGKKSKRKYKRSKLKFKRSKRRYK